MGQTAEFAVGQSLSDSLLDTERIPHFISLEEYYRLGR
jgi:hypothetical protein